MQTTPLHHCSLYVWSHSAGGSVVSKPWQAGVSCCACCSVILQQRGWPSACDAGRCSRCAVWRSGRWQPKLFFSAGASAGTCGTSAGCAGKHQHQLRGRRRQRAVRAEPSDGLWLLAFRLLSFWRHGHGLCAWLDGEQRTALRDEPARERGQCYLSMQTCQGFIRNLFGVGREHIMIVD